MQGFWFLFYLNPRISSMSTKERVTQNGSQLCICQCSVRPRPWNELAPGLPASQQDMDAACEFKTKDNQDLGEKEKQRINHPINSCQKTAFEGVKSREKEQEIQEEEHLMEEKKKKKQEEKKKKEGAQKKSK
nr:glutamic acid-rich protein-like isoform X2 [Chrysemys picta bellii]